MRSAVRVADRADRLALALLPPTAATLHELARLLAVDEMHAERDVRPRPGPVRCDVDRRRRLERLARDVA